ncbi:sulfur carrier protein [Herbihabitans rhizosphaerae]|uniref:Sulfur carrier protein n=1 Tax=Herbihabitans rhizosphaerae TaxID=1872711 RepID=A0A4V2ETH9_9PSEU|nr:sulfur carrier protein ThiS [Herbihabitans rhizosphaerae]RZS41133.1 sulfur carrier protein [Herbihabitans rhizosphaerae]
MKVRLNDDIVELADGATVADALDHLGYSPNGLAVAVDGEVVPRAAHRKTRLVEGTTVDVLSAVQGG